MVGSGLNESVLLEQQGVFALVDALELAPAALHGPVLACLMDLCRNATAAEHVRHWRSKGVGQMDVVRLMLRMWRDEQDALGVVLAEDGILAGVWCGDGCGLVNQLIN